ncbi:MAG TPA: protein kinase [Edaphobacter sp.]|nr:protein kinase [Edaphobacter sp.]
MPTVIRLIESHFDGDEILARWRGVAALNHPNLVKLKSFGHVVVDETSLVYAVMEPVEANLSEILRERRLTELETKQVATSLLAAMEALHSSGFVHEHVVAENVLAVGEVIKLRSDCIRETLEGEEGVALKRKDVRDFATLLLQALTQQRTFNGASREPPLPAPFEQIVRRGMSGEWGLAEIGAALKRPSVAQAIARAGVTPDAPKVEMPVAAPAGASSGTAASVAPVSEVPPSGTAPSVARRIRVPVDGEPRKFGPRGIAYAVGTLLILLLGWLFVHSRSSSSSGSSGSSGSPGSTGAIQETPASAPSAQESAPVAATGPAAPADVESHPASRAVASSAPAATGTDASGDSRGRWRVIAFTYNREDQAQQKAAEIAKSHPDLNPTIFRPNGRGPFLVTLGGPMSRDDAFAFSGKAKREGMPRDIYAQNYRGNGK